LFHSFDYLAIDGGHRWVAVCEVEMPQAELRLDNRLACRYADASKTAYVFFDSLCLDGVFNLYLTFLASASKIILWAKFSFNLTNQPADSISPSSSSTPGSTGNAGKWSAKYSSDSETFLIVFIPTPAVIETTLSIKINLISAAF
jgi:hypothetical protein